MKTSSIKYNAYTQKGIRFDASFHLSDGLVTKRLIESSPYPLKTIGDVSSRIFFGNRAKRVYVTKKENGIPFLSSSDILRSDLENVKLASKKYMPVSDMKLEKGWTLISRSGTIGNCAFANAKHAQKLASEHVIRLLPNNILRGGLVYAYLASKYGYSLLTQGTFGAVIQHIEPDFVSSIPIPSFPEDFQNKINDLVLESARLREEAADVLDRAVSSVSRYINSNHKEHPFNCGKVNSQEIFHSLKMRIDPPALINDGVVAMNEVIEKMSFKRIGELGFTVRRPGIFKRVKVEKGIPYIKGSEIFLTNPFRRCEYLSKSRTPFIDEMVLKSGQILVTCAGSVGDIKMITQEYEDKCAIGSQDIIRIDSFTNKDELFNKEYLFTYLQLPFVYSYIQSMKYGSVIERIEPFHIESIPVVEPTPELSKKVKTLISSYMDDLYKAFCLEEEAIYLVEQEIEKWNK